MGAPAWSRTATWMVEGFGRGRRTGWVADGVCGAPAGGVCGVADAATRTKPTEQHRRFINDRVSARERGGAPAKSIGQTRRRDESSSTSTIKSTIPSPLLG